MKKKYQVSIGAIIVIIVYLFLTNPSESKYVSWLENNHEISCINDGLALNCKQAKEIIEWKSRSVNDYGIFSIYRDYYEDKNGEKIEIKAIGILNIVYNK
ncbi:hypothetical protein GC098_02350 [Paenibacillus sp. LMG 31458]|uniref:DUF4359 domain-containing protein n=1 Tax=Paenibacillus phytorum TaxID=2654977 RepID=A0ABX1XP30_9BACL|nr:hypothetical protein [Paenibacillus phytorum]NOU70288.1 hypothetical protein [Paenibacillus phytorum]